MIDWNTELKSNTGIISVSETSGKESVLKDTIDKLFLKP